jgi:transcriptional regulator with XRE-family HTH domain
MQSREVLARNLRVLRRAKGLSQEEVAHRAEIDRTYVSAIERCVYSVSLDVLDRLAAALDVAPAELLLNELEDG